jgi:hypothetical protein
MIRKRITAPQGGWGAPSGSLSRLVNVSRQKDVLNENGGLTNSTSLNACVDMFFMAGAARHWTDADIEALFQKALAENPLTALKLMFWVRDVRGGAGERRFFRVCLKYLERYYLGYLKKNAHLIPEYGRWDDVFELDKDVYMPLVKDGFENKNGLLGKWAPRKGSVANVIRKSLGLSPKDYRKTIVSLSQTVEQLMCAKQFEGINYEHVPSVAMNKYRKAFYRNDSNRFVDYINAVKSGTAKMCAGAIYPYQLYDAFLKSRSEIDTQAIEAQWYSIPNYMEGSTVKLIPMVDTSSSMTWQGGLPSRVAWSLGVYISERNESIFKDAFMTFATSPQMLYLKGTVSDRLRAISRAPWGGTTNIDAAFSMLLAKAIENQLTEAEMPSIILILSDMQFDPAKTSYNHTTFEMIKARYAKAGYKVPKVIFWNLRAEKNNVVASAFDENVGLVSGFSPSCLKSILLGEEVQNEDEPKKDTPYELMMKTIDSERYAPVTI